MDRRDGQALRVVEIGSWPSSQREKGHCRFGIAERKYDPRRRTDCREPPLYRWLIPRLWLHQSRRQLTVRFSLPTPALSSIALQRRVPKPSLPLKNAAQQTVHEHSEKVTHAFSFTALPIERDADGNANGHRFAVYEDRFKPPPANCRHDRLIEFRRRRLEMKRPDCPHVGDIARLVDQRLATPDRGHRRNRARWQIGIHGFHIPQLSWCRGCLADQKWFDADEGLALAYAGTPPLDRHAIRREAVTRTGRESQHPGEAQ